MLNYVNWRATWRMTHLLKINVEGLKEWIRITDFKKNAILLQIELGHQSTLLYSRKLFTIFYLIGTFYFRASSGGHGMRKTLFILYIHHI